jgi:glycosyltransferase involved in cell wall biosynthesis
MHRLGHDVRIVVPTSLETVQTHGASGALARIRPLAERLRTRGRADWQEVLPRVTFVRDPSPRNVPDGDVVIATWWRTAEWVSTYGDRKGRKFHLVQHYEIWAGPRERVDATYRLGLTKIVVSSWLKRVLQERFGETSLGPILSGLDPQRFHPDPSVPVDPRLVGMMYHILPWKGALDGIRAFEAARAHCLDARLVLFGKYYPGFELPEDAEFHYDPSPATLRSIYSRCGVWVLPSLAEGAGLPVIEAMACDCAVAATDVGAVRDYAVPGESVLVSPPGDPEALARNILILLQDEDRRQRIAQTARAHIQRFTWDKADREFEAAILESQ